MIARVLTFALIALNLSLGSSGAPVAGATIKARIVKAVGANGRIWLLLEDGKVATMDRADQITIDPALEQVFDLCASDNAVTVAMAPKGNPENWVLRRRIGAGWEDITRIAAAKGKPVGLACRGRDATLLTTTHAIAFDAAGRHEVSLDGDELSPALVNSSLLQVGASLYLARNNGEWGGGLLRIDLRTGKVARVERNASGSLCGGPLNGECDPVNALVIDPWKPDCAIATIGLVHMAAHGRIVEICGTKVRRLYFRPYPGAEEANRRAAENVKNDPKYRHDDEPFETDAFFGMAVVGTELWVAGTQWLYRFGPGGGDPVIAPMPKFRTVGGVHIADVTPGLMLVSSDINSKASLGGGPLILVER